MNFTKIVTSILSSVSNCIHSKEYAQQHRIKNAFTRSRKLSFSDIMLYVISSSHHSISVNYARFRNILNNENLPN